METLEYVSLREAAQLLGITLRAVRGRVKSRNVPMVTVAGKHGDRYLLQREHLSLLGESTTEEPWAPDESPRGDWTLFKTMPGEGYRAPRPPEGTVAGEGDETVSETVTEGAPRPSDTVPGEGVRSEPGIPVAVHRSALETTRKALEAAREAQARADEATERWHRLERTTWALQMELTSYQRALTDQAESLAEREALRCQAAKQQSQFQELASQKKLETEHLTDALRQAESRVQALEQKVPRWLRRLFGA